MHYWHRVDKGYSGPYNLPEIEKEEYGYILEPGQTISGLRYERSNKEIYIHPVIEKVDDEGIYISKHLEGGSAFVPWKITEFYQTRSADVFVKL